MEFSQSPVFQAQIILLKEELRKAKEEYDALPYEEQQKIDMQKAKDGLERFKKEIQAIEKELKWKIY